MINTIRQERDYGIRVAEAQEQILKDLRELQEDYRSLDSDFRKQKSLLKQKDEHIDKLREENGILQQQNRVSRNTPGPSGNASPRTDVNTTRDERGFTPALGVARSEKLADPDTFDGTGSKHDRRHS